MEHVARIAVILVALSNEGANNSSVVKIETALENRNSRFKYKQRYKIIIWKILNTNRMLCMAVTINRVFVKHY